MRAAVASRVATGAAVRCRAEVSSGWGGRCPKRCRGWPGGMPGLWVVSGGGSWGSRRGVWRRVRSSGVSRGAGGPRTRRTTRGTPGPRSATGRSRGVPGAAGRLVCRGGAPDRSGGPVAGGRRGGGAVRGARVRRRAAGRSGARHSRDFLGEPQPRTLYYFDGPRPESQWFWRPLLAEWLTYTVLPAFGCAVLLTVGAVVSARCSRRDRFGWAVPALVGVGLLLLPGWAAAGLPEPQGNGDHVNESAGAGLVVLATGLGLLLSAWAVRSWRGARRPVGPRAPVLTPARSSPTPPRSARGGG